MAAGILIPMPKHTKNIRKRAVPGLTERLLSLRAAIGLSQQVLATRAGISIPRLRDAETHGFATTETLTLLARVLGVDFDHLTGLGSAAKRTEGT